MAEHKRLELSLSISIVCLIEELTVVVFQAADQGPTDHGDGGESWWVEEGGGCSGRGVAGKSNFKTFLIGRRKGKEKRRNEEKI